MMPVNSMMSAGSGLESIESRVKQIEAMIQAMEGQKPEKLNPAAEQKLEKPNFKSFLQKPTQVNSSGATLTGRIESGLGSLTARAQAFQPMVEEYSAKYGVDKELINAVIRQESGFNPAAVSKAGARGLMQLMPGTAKSLGVQNPNDPRQNMDGGVRLLKQLLENYHGNIPLALAAYNAGPGAVKRHKGIPPYKETQNYVRNILAMYLKDKQAS
jgi:soluble lytic murein transglycosylase-like protein